MKAAIIVAGGSGTRMNSPAPKQFLLLDKVPVLVYSLMAFCQADPSIRLLVVLPEHLFGQWDQLIKKHRISIRHDLVSGGETRFHSVSNGLQCLDQDGLVAIHDGARPLLSCELIQRLFTAAETEGNAIPVTPINESIREVEGSNNQPADRARYRMVQTPQVFRTTQIREAYRQPFQPGFTDDATVLESMGHAIHLVDGDPVNLKITYSSDLLLAEAFLKAGR